MNSPPLAATSSLLSTPLPAAPSPCTACVHRACPHVTGPPPPQVIRHRSDEERSGVYDKLLECEELAKGAKRGLHSNKEAAPNRVNDVSQPGNATKWVG